jgi:hypothetical protein
MKTRATIVATSLLVLAGAGYASAAPAKAAKPVCNLIADDKGDSGISPVPGADGDDIVSADIATDAKTVTAVIRLAGLSDPDPQAPLGRSYSVLFTAPGSADLLYLAARTYPQGTKYIYGYQAVDPNTGVTTNYTLGDATGAVDAAKGEVHVSAPVKAFVDGAKAKLAKGAKLAGLSASVDRIYGQGVVPSQSPAPGAPRVPLGGFTLQFDDATGGSYFMGTPSCVAVGK